MRGNFDSLKWLQVPADYFYEATLLGLGKIRKVAFARRSVEEKQISLRVLGDFEVRKSIQACQLGTGDILAGECKTSKVFSAEREEI